MPIFSFVLLNYNNFNDTNECILSLLNNIHYDKYYIIVVDNGSIDKSNKLLEEKYKNFEKIIIINNNDNLGFSKGNNVGFIYAKHQLKSDFICLLNNDTIVKQKNFINIVMEKYNKYKFGVLGPDIISTKDGKHTNPQLEVGRSIHDYVKYIFKMRFYLILNYICLDKIVRIVLHSIKKKIAKDNELNYKNEKFDVQLHGACLIFSPIFVNKYDGILEKTFMYMEEDILYNMCKKSNIRIMYTPNLLLYHKEGSTLEKINKKGGLNRRFYYKKNIEAASIVKKMLQENDIN